MLICTVMLVDESYNEGGAVRNGQQRETVQYEKKSSGINVSFKKPRERTNFVKRFIAVFCLLVVLFLPYFSEAGEWWFTPRIGLYGGYDDNITFATTDKIDSYIINVEPGFKLTYGSLLSTLNLAADWDILRYLDNGSLNRVNHDYRLDGTHKIGQRWDTRANFRYIQDTTLNSYLEEIGNVIERVDREYYEARAGVAYAMSTVSYIDTEYSYEKANYEDDIFPSFSRHRLYVYYQHHLKSQQDVLALGPSFYHRKNDFDTTDYVSFDLGWNRDWSDITTTYASVGARYTMAEDEAGTDATNWGAIGRFDFTRLGKVSTTRFEYYHDLGTSAFGADLNVDNFYLRYDYWLTERFGLGIDGRLIFSYDLFQEEEEAYNSRYFEIQPYLSYRLTERLNMYLRYKYQHSSENLFDNKNVSQRNSLWVEFQYDFPIKL